MEADCYYLNDYSLIKVFIYFLSYLSVSQMSFWILLSLYQSYPWFILKPISYYRSDSLDYCVLFKTNHQLASQTYYSYNPTTKYEFEMKHEIYRDETPPPHPTFCSSLLPRSHAFAHNSYNIVAKH